MLNILQSSLIKRAAIHKFRIQFEKLRLHFTITTFSCNLMENFIRQK